MQINRNPAWTTLSKTGFPGSLIGLFFIPLNIQCDSIIYKLRLSIQTIITDYFQKLFWWLIQIFSIDDQIICEQKHFFLPSLYTFYFLCVCVIVLASTCSMMLKMNGERGLLYLVPDLSGKVSSFSPLSIKLAEVFCRYYLSSWGILLLFLVYWEFLSCIGVRFLSNAFSASDKLCNFSFLVCRSDELY